MASKKYSSGNSGYFSLPLLLHSSSNKSDERSKRLTRELRRPENDFLKADFSSHDASPEQKPKDASAIFFDNAEELAFFQACEQQLKDRTDLEGDKESSPDTTSPCQNTLERYLQACEFTDTCPLSTFMRQIGRRVIRLCNGLLHTMEIKAVCHALFNDDVIEHLDLSGNNCNVQSVRYVTQLIANNSGLQEMTARDNLLNGPSLHNLVLAVRDVDHITRLDLSGNKLKDTDAQTLAHLLKNNKVLEYLDISNNELAELAGKLIGQALARNSALKELDLSWNHLRFRGAVDIARSLKNNRGLLRLNVDWNGFSYEGAAALGDALRQNHTLMQLDLAYNRIHNDGLLQLCKGLFLNKTLVFLKLSHNPLWSIHLQVLICGIRDAPHMALKYLDLSGLVIENEFLEVTREIQARSTFSVTYGTVLPAGRSSGYLEPLVGLKDVNRMDPAEILQFLKDKMRVIDLFWRIDRDNSNTLSRAELHVVLEEAGLPVTARLLDDVMNFVDTDHNGEIDMSEFFDAHRRSRRKLRNRKQQVERMKSDKYTQYTESFREMEYGAQCEQIVSDVAATVMVEKAVDSLVGPRRTRDEL